MLKQLKNNFQAYVSIVLIISFLSSTLKSQEKNITFIIKKNPNHTNYWWINSNNFGERISDFNLSNRFELKKNNTTYVMDIFAGLNDNKLENIYLNQSFIKYECNNARAMKKIGLVNKKTFEKNKKISFDIGIAHALFNKSESYIDAPQLHEKFIYINIKKIDYEYGVGLVHEAMWGGNIKNIGRQPDKFKDFLKVFIASDGDFVEGKAHANALGNHLGIWDFYYIKSQDTKILKLYYQHFFEDTSGLRFANKSDGLWGIELVEYFPNTNIVLEYLNTTNQDINPPYVEDSYYNHSEYIDGWSYKNHSIGNPFIKFLETNPLEVFHLGIKGSFSNKYNYQFLGSRRVDSSDTIKYKIKLEKEVKKNSLFLNTFIINDSQRNGIGFGVYWVL